MHKNAKFCNRNTFKLGNAPGDLAVVGSCRRQDGNGNGGYINSSEFQDGHSNGNFWETIPKSNKTAGKNFDSNGNWARTRDPRRGMSCTS